MSDAVSSGNGTFAGRRAARVSMVLLLGFPVGLFVSIIWAGFVKTSPTTSDEDRVRGWSSVLRELPATAFFVGTLLVGMVLAVRAIRRGATRSGHRAIWWHGAALFVALVIILNGSAENVMTTRPSTVKWILFPVQVGLALGAVVVARRAAGQPLTGRARSS